MSGQPHGNDDDSEDGGSQIWEEIHEALAICRLQGHVAPVRVARILAGESTDRFSGDVLSSARSLRAPDHTVPLSVALEYVGSILDDSRKEINRLKASRVLLCLLRCSCCFAKLTRFPFNYINSLRWRSTML